MPQDAGLFLDFDGTLSEIVVQPSEARPTEGVRETLGSLAERYRVVAIVSGRSAGELVEWLGAGTEIWGAHGAERVQDGKVVLSEHLQRYVELMQQVRDTISLRLADLGIPGAFVEDKGVVLALHWRGARDSPEAEARISALVDEFVARHGLVRAEGRKAIELRPPVELSKGSIVLRRTREENLRAVAFVGDDKVDLDAFDALDELDAGGIGTVRVAVQSAEAPPELIDRADVVVHGPSGVLAWLRGLLA